MRPFTFTSALVLFGLTGGFAVQPNAARADLIKLDMLTKACGDKSAVLRGNCEGYIAGIADMLEDEHMVCLGDARLRAVRELVVGYLQSHHFPGDSRASNAIGEALKAGYACKKP